MICITCSKERLNTNNGICVICEPKVIFGHEKEITNNYTKNGVEIKIKYNKQEHVWMS